MNRIIIFHSENHICRQTKQSMCMFDIFECSIIEYDGGIVTAAQFDADQTSPSFESLPTYTVLKDEGKQIIFKYI